MAGTHFTHDVLIGEHVVTKRYASWDRGEPQREWTALTVLAEHAPDLAPEPVEAALDASPPAIVMTRLPGQPVRGLPACPGHAPAMAAAVNELHAAVPAHVVRSLPPAPWGPATAVTKYRRLARQRPDPGPSPLARKALDAGTAWLGTPAVDRLVTDPLPPVLGLADGNHANYLRDEDRVRLIDWEDSGRSDRAFELAEIAEHISHLDDGFDPDLFLAAAGLTAVEVGRVGDFRRLLALGWLLLLVPGGPIASRNPADALERQAERVLSLLG